MSNVAAENAAFRFIVGCLVKHHGNIQKSIIDIESNLSILDGYASPPPSEIKEAVRKLREDFNLT